MSPVWQSESNRERERESGKGKARTTRYEYLYNLKDMDRFREEEGILFKSSDIFALFCYGLEVSLDSLNLCETLRQY